MRHDSIVLVAMLFLGVCWQGSTVADAATLVRDGEPAAVIVTAQKPTPAARLAALELQHHIELITGARLPIQAPGGAASGVRILVGESAATHGLGLKGADFQPQEYLIRIQDDTIVLMGRDWEDTDANRKEAGCDILKSIADWRNKVNYDGAVGRKDGGAGEIELPGAFDDQGTCTRRTISWSDSAMSAGTARPRSTS